MFLLADARCISVSVSRSLVCRYWEFVEYSYANPFLGGLRELQNKLQCLNLYVSQQLTQPFQH